MIDTAQVAKDKGNAAFKAGDFPNAIGHYTTAIFSDRSDYTLPLNRAAAYLKLGKNDDAEKDCTAVLSLNVGNVKALFRRGQARLGMGNFAEAQQDFIEALKKEPSNESVKEQLEKLFKLVDQEKVKASKSFTEPIRKRRRVPINIIHPNMPDSPVIARPGVREAPSKSGLVVAAAKSDILQAVSSRPLATPRIAPSLSPSSVPSSSSSTNTDTSSPAKQDQSLNFKDARQARENAKLSRVGGGIFRASGDHKVLARGNDQHAVSPPSTNPSSVSANLNKETTSDRSPIPMKPPTTLFDFSRSWQSFSSSEERWNLISTVIPSSLPTLFKSSLEPTLLVSILQMFGEQIQDGREKMIKEYMENLSQVPRFGTVLLFLSRGEKDIVKELLKNLGFNKNSVASVWSVVW